MEYDSSVLSEFNIINVFIQRVAYLYGEEFIQGYFILYHVEVAVVQNAISRYHDEVNGTLILRQLLICIQLILQVLSVILVNGEDISRTYVSLDTSDAKGCFNLRNVLKTYPFKSVSLPCVMGCGCAVV